MVAVAQGVPQLNSPMVDRNGAVTQPWYLFFNNLWVRTGSGTGTNFAPADEDYIVGHVTAALPNARLVTNSPTATWDLTVAGHVKVNVTLSSVVIPESQVINLVSDLAARALTSTLISAGTGLTGGGSLATNRTISVATNGIDNSLLAQMPTLTLKGNNTLGTANALDLTVAQMNAILPVFTSTLNGLAPLSGGGTANFLRADGSWAPPTTSGASGSVTLAALSGLGTTGSLTFVNGLITAFVAPT